MSNFHNFSSDINLQLCFKILVYITKCRLSKINPSFTNHKRTLFFKFWIRALDIVPWRWILITHQIHMNSIPWSMDHVTLSCYRNKHVKLWSPQSSPPTQFSSLISFCPYQGARAPAAPGAEQGASLWEGDLRSPDQTRLELSFYLRLTREGPP